MMKITILEITYNQYGHEFSLFPTVLSHEKETILIDCGYENSLPLIEQEMIRQDIDPTSVTRIIISHDDIDHLGGLKEWKDKYPHLRVGCSEIEEPYVSGKKKSLRLIQAEDLMDTMPEDQKPGALQFQDMLKKIRRIPVDDTFSYDAVPEFLPGVQVVNTPGHTPGHVSFYIPSKQTLIASDALVVDQGEFELANPQFTLHMEDAIRSVRKIKGLAPETVICYHGGVIRGNIPQKLDKLLTKYS